MSFMHHVRRQVQRARPGRVRGWRRTYRYRVERIGYGVTVRTPMSRDAPIGPEDERFWKRADFVVGLLVLVGVLAALVLRFV